MTQKNKEPVKRIRSGDVTAEIFEKATTDGYRYYEYSLRRVHNSKTYSTFHDSSVGDVAAAATQASAWIKDKTTARP